MITQTEREEPARVSNNDFELLMAGRHHDPFALLGRKVRADGTSFYAFRPSAETLKLRGNNGEWLAMRREEGTDIFFWRGKEAIAAHPQLLETAKDGRERLFVDPYSFTPCLDSRELSKYGRENHWRAYDLLGSRLLVHEGIEGALFSVWAPNAERVSVVGDFNDWDGRVHPMRSCGDSGVWELFIPGIGAKANYKYELRQRGSGQVSIKADPYARCYEIRPNTASQVADDSQFHWRDDLWMARRKECDWLHSPTSIYEVHLGSWRKHTDGSFYTYRELAEDLVDYVVAQGFTHIELLPITEHPFDGSWGYQVTGYFAPTSRYGSADDFRFFVNRCHEHNIGVILDWVPAHFPKDAHGLARFDGTALYEHDDPRLGEHRDWDTLIFNYGRQEVANFLISSADYWLREFHLDGLRVDAVASMIYLDYSREDGEWLPNRYGGNENLEAIEFLRAMNCILHEQHPGALIIAEESTAWPQVSRPVYVGGLGFSLKWNMGWMNDTLEYMSLDPIHRQYHHDQLTFGLLYAFTENFVLPFSHDEVVHGKRSLLNRMPGDGWQQFANLRLLYTYLFAYPGKKLLFMGDEFGQGREWDHDGELEWRVLDTPWQRGLQKLVTDLNNCYRNDATLFKQDFDQEGFRWIDCRDHKQSVISFLRYDGEEFTIVVLNFTPVPRHQYRIGVPAAGVYGEIINSDSKYYGGSNVSNGTAMPAEKFPWMGFEWSLSLDLPPLGGLYIKRFAHKPNRA